MPEVTVKVTDDQMAILERAREELDVDIDMALRMSVSGGVEALSDALQKEANATDDPFAGE